MESLLQYNIIHNIIHMVTVLLITFMLHFCIGGADPQSDDAQEKSLSTVWSHDPFSCSWSSESAVLTPRKFCSCQHLWRRVPHDKVIVSQ